MKKRILSLLLVLAMTCGMLPTVALAADEDETVIVNFTSQAAGAFLHAPQLGAEVSGGLAEQYGYADKVTDGVSALDVLVKAHEVIFGEDFTEESAREYLDVSESGSVTTIFHEETMSNSFVVNNAFPNDGTESDYGVNGTVINTHKVENGDLVEFFIYQDSESWLDELEWITFGGKDADGLAFAPNANIELTVNGVAYMWYGYLSIDKEALRAFGETREGAQLAWVDIESAEVTDIENAVADENGKVTVTMPETPGEYYLTAYMPQSEIDENYASPMVMSLTKITIDENAPVYEDCDLTSLSVTGLDKNPAPLSLTPDFKGENTEYTAETAGYDSMGFLYVKAQAYNENAVITAECNGKSAEITSGDANWKLLIGALKPGQDNILKITVTSEDSEKVYTVTVPMAPDPDCPTIKGDSESHALVAVGDTYKLDLGTVFEDNNNENLTYTVSVDSADAVSANREYEFTPTEAGEYILQFTAYDGDKASPLYTLKLTAMEQDELLGVKAKELLDNIAAKYVNKGVAGDDNGPWLAADLAEYLKTYPDTENKLSEKQKLDMARISMGVIKTTTKPSDAAKHIIALTAMGYDVQKVIDFSGEECDYVEKYLIPLCFDEEGNITNGAKNQYTLPYVLIAFEQFGEKYNAEIEKLVAAALSTEAQWTNVRGTDGATPMIRALAPYRDTIDGVEESLNRAAGIVKGKQTSDGGTGNAASTALSMMAFAALGENPAEVKHDETGKSLVDALMASASEDGFTGGMGSFLDEQGMRGLLSYVNMPDEGSYYLYDFNGLNRDILKEDQPEVRFAVVPEGAKVTVKQGEVEQNTDVPYNYDLTAGQYTYTVEKEGYITKSGEFTVTEEDENGNDTKVINVSLVSDASGETEKKITVSVKVLTHDEHQCGGKWTYKDNASAYTVKLAELETKMKAGQSVFDALALALDRAGVSYTEKSYGYVSEIAGYEEFGHGSDKSGWLYMVNGVVEETGSRDCILDVDSEVIWFYTDDYTREYGSESFGGGPSNNAVSDTEKLIDAIGKVTLDSKEAIEKARSAYDRLSEEQKKLVNNYDVLVKAEQDYEKLVTASMPFTDMDGHWALSAVKYVYDRKIMEGTSDTLFEPDTKVNRAMMAAILYKMAGNPEIPNSDNVSFADIDVDKDIPWAADAIKWAVRNGIIEGYTDGALGAYDFVTREQAVVMLYRYAKLNGFDISSGEGSGALSFNDADDISLWALTTMKWAVNEGILKGTDGSNVSPKGDASRAMIAAIVMRFEESDIK